MDLRLGFWGDGSDDGDSLGVGQVIANFTRGGVPMGLRRGFCCAVMLISGTRPCCVDK